MKQELAIFWQAPISIEGNFVLSSHSEVKGKYEVPSIEIKVYFRFGDKQPVQNTLQ